MSVAGGKPGAWLLVAAFMTAAVCFTVRILGSAPAQLTSLLRETRLMTAAPLEARARAARDGSLTLEPWACPGIERFSDALHVAAEHAGFMGLRLAYVTRASPSSALEGSRILMADLFPHSFCTPLPLEYLQIGLINAADPRLALLGPDLARTELFLVDRLSESELHALLSTQHGPPGGDRLILLRSLSPSQHWVISTAIERRARAGDPDLRDIAALLP